MTVHPSPVQDDFAARYLAQTDAPLPPLVPGLPLLGNALNLRGDMTDFLVKSYHRYGPVFRIRVLNRTFTILAGLEANQFLMKAGDDLLHSAGFFGGFGREMDGGAFLPEMDGQPHLHLRKILRAGYTREALRDNYPQVIDIARRFARGWQPGQRVQVVPAMQRLITEQLGIILGGRSPGDYFDDIRVYLRTLVDVTLLQTAPRLMLRLPRYRRAKARVFELMRSLIEQHRQTPRGGDLFDIALAARDMDGQPLREEDLIAIGLGAYVAGMDTLANTISFMLYALLRHPAALAEVTAEVDAAFAQGAVNGQTLRGMNALHGAAVETLRMYMISPVTLRTARRPFVFAGHRVEAGTDLMIATGVTHFLPEFFPDPFTFRLDRDTQTRHPHTYTPFSLGAHTCLGAGLAETLLMLTTAVLLHTVRLELSPRNFEARIKSTPAPNPGMNFYAKVVSHR